MRISNNRGNSIGRNDVRAFYMRLATGSGLVELSEEIELDWPEFLLVIKVGITQIAFGS